MEVSEIIAAAEAAFTDLGEWIVDPQLFEDKSEPTLLTPDVSSYSQHLAGTEFLSLFQSQPPGLDFPWLFAHRSNAKGAMHVAPVVEGADGRQSLHLIHQKHFTLGGKPSWMWPAGLWGDKDPREAIRKVIRRELHEETGFEVADWGLLASGAVLASPGAITEQKVLALAKVSGMPTGRFRDKGERMSIIDTVDVPVRVMAHPRARRRWMNLMTQNGHALNIEVPAAIGLMHFIRI